MNLLSSLTVFQAFQSHLKDRKPTTSNNTDQELSNNLISSETWTTMSSTVASFFFAWAIVCQYSPYEVRGLVNKLKLALRDYYDSHVTIKFTESSERMKHGDAYLLIEAYLASKATVDSKQLRAKIASDSLELSLSMDDFQEVTDVFCGVKFVWSLKRVPESEEAPKYEKGKRFYEVVFNRRHRAMAINQYLKHVMREGREAKALKRCRRLYNNNSGGYPKMWSHVPFEHPAKLENMALDPAVREDIKEDLMAFAENREFYERAGRAWKRGYLLHGPPGTGKSTMIAAMANLLNYDVYDLELTAVSDNTDLRKLLLQTSSKAIIVVEDIDCSLDLTGQRKKKEVTVKEMESKVTLSGLLNVIDGIWSSCGSEKLIVFTTNHIEKLDPALIRSGRMDKHIELSYCTFEGFKVLAKNYLGVESHPMFDEIERLIGEVEITPADLAESLVPRSHREGAERCLLNLVRALQKAKKKRDNATLESVKTG